MDTHPPRLSLLLLCLLAACAHAPSSAEGPSRPSNRCLLVDSDAALDDFRALGALLPAGVTVLVATEGISTGEGGAMALAHLAATAPEPPPVLVGIAPRDPKKEPWLDEVRTNAERLNGLLTASVPFRSSGRIVEELEALTASCDAIDVALLGPWTSFLEYEPRLGRKIARVLVQGLPPEEAGERPGFNCRYDLPACVEGSRRVQQRGVGIWVDVPRDRSAGYVPTPAMFEGLEPRGLPGTLRALFLANRPTWDHAFLWDDAVAVYLLHPEAFQRRGAHFEPAVEPEALRALWQRAVAGPDLHLRPERAAEVSTTP